MGDAKNNNLMYIYELPYVVNKKLCSILDINDSWEELGERFMNFKYYDLERFRRAESPTRKMLREYSHQNDTVLQLYKYLLEMGHYEAMSALKSCVAPKYHKLFDSRERYKYLPTRESRSVMTGTTEGAVGGESRSVLMGTTEGAVGGASVMTSSKQISNGTESTLLVTNGQLAQHQSQKVEVEGATALPSSASKYGPENLNATSSRQELVSSKVPQTLLSPCPITNPQNTKVDSSQSRHSKYGGKLEAIPETKKINNNGPSRKFTEVSCEDNNPEESHLVYDPTQDYLRKVEEKRMKEVEADAAAREHRNSNSIVGVPLKLKTNVTALPAPVASIPTVPTRQNNGLNARSQVPTQERERRISNASRHECIVPVIPYKELEEATSCWSEDNLLGRGGFGTVYRGSWKNTQVAIKRINLQENANFDSAELQITQSLEELKILQSFPHDNILQVYGYSADDDQPPCLVYQFMPNGSLEDRLQLRKIHSFVGGSPCGNWTPLNWWQRYRIALGTAKALQYLHRAKDKPLIHGDVKSANILLDQNNEPKLGDFGLAKEGKSLSTSLTVSRVHGTRPYLPTDYLRSKKLCVKVDTYSYGIVLFEVCTGLRAYDDKRKEGQKFLREHVEETANDESLRDPNIGQEPEVIFSVLFNLAKDCVIQLVSRRPDMEKVFNDLNSFGVYLKEQARARHISGDQGPLSNSPLQLQRRYDTGRSIQSPSLSPSTHPSLQYPYYPSPAPSGPMLVCYPSPSSTSYVPPRSPVPPLMAPPSIPPHYPPHPGSYAYRHAYRHQVCNAVNWNQGVGEPLQYGIGTNHLHETINVPQININPVVNGGDIGRGPPPTYDEATSPGALGINPLLPQLSALNISSTSTHSVDNPSDSRCTIGSSTNSSESSYVANTTQNVSQARAQNGYATPSQGAAAAYFPTGISTDSGEHGGAYIPLLTEVLGHSSSKSSLSSNLGFVEKPPTAKNKKSLFD